MARSANINGRGTLKVAAERTNMAPQWSPCAWQALKRGAGVDMQRRRPAVVSQDEASGKAPFMP